MQCDNKTNPITNPSKFTKMKTFKITLRTNPWIAQRDIRFKGHTHTCTGMCEVTLHSHLTKKEANDMLFDFFREDYEEKGAYNCTNWGLAVMNFDGICGTSNGLRYYEYDSRYYNVEEETEEDYEQEDEELEEDEDLEDED